MEEREKKERVMCLIGHVSNFVWGNGRNEGKEMEISFSLYWEWSCLIFVHQICEFN